MDLINQIIKIEWSFFQETNNAGGRASCQNNFSEFYLMRSAQWEIYPEEILELILNELNDAYLNGRNLVVEKYARMMKYTHIDEYLTLESRLPSISEQHVLIVNQIINSFLVWHEKFRLRYPKLSKKSRSMLTNSSDGATSACVYLESELLTYSLATLMHVLSYVDECKINNINLVIENINNIVRKKGYNSLVDAENSL